MTRKTRKPEKTERGRPTPAPTAQNAAVLFLETTAQFHRLTGPQAFQETIEKAINSSGRVGTSAHVKREFDYVYGEFFKKVIYNVGRLPGQAVRRSCAGIWTDVQKLMPKYYPGGPSVFLSISLTLTEIRAGRPTAPTMLLNMIEGFKQRLLGGFYWGEFLTDKSSCGLWHDSPNCYCGPVPGEGCRLKEICITSREEFIKSLRTLASTSLDESKWLKENLPLIEQLRGKEFMQLVCDNPGHFGDPIIFWEAPDGSTILTNDIAYRKLHKKQRKEEVLTHILRLPREDGGGACKILPTLPAAFEVDGELINHSPQGALIRAPGISVKRRQLVTVTAQAFVNGGDGEGRREARVVDLYGDDKAIFSVRFPSP